MKNLPIALSKTGNNSIKVKGAAFFDSKGVFIRSSLDAKSIEEVRTIAAFISGKRNGEKITYLVKEEIIRNVASIEAI